MRAIAQTEDFGETAAALGVEAALDRARLMNPQATRVFARNDIIRAIDPPGVVYHGFFAGLDT